MVAAAAGARMHLDAPGDPPGQVASALGLVRDLLSPGMRLRERRAGRWPHRWYLESFDGGTWRVEHETGLPLWNFLQAADLREPLAPRRAREAFERAYERELYRRQVENLSGHAPAAA